MGLYSAVTEAIEAYTGLSPMAFFTILALMVGVYKLVSSMFVVPEDFKALREAYLHQAQANMAMGGSSSYPVAEPVQLGDVTEDQLRAYDGSDPRKPLLMAIKGQIYDVSRSRMFYGPGGPYALFAGRDASRALALMSFDPKDLTGNIEGLSSSELEILQDWEYKFMEKYVKVGQLVTENTTVRDTGIQEKTGENEETKRKSDDGSLNLNSKAAEAEVGAI